MQMVTQQITVIKRRILWDDKEVLSIRRMNVCRASVEETLNYYLLYNLHIVNMVVNHPVHEQSGEGIPIPSDTCTRVHSGLSIFCMLWHIS